MIGRDFKVSLVNKYNGNKIIDVYYVPEDHILPNCTMNLREQLKVITNYEAMDESQKRKVPLD